MMGRRECGQGQLFYSFDLDEVVPVDHLMRQISVVLQARHRGRDTRSFGVQPSPA
jgi:hypothetical protein